MSKALQKRIELFFSLSIYFGVSFSMLLQTRLIFEFFHQNFSTDKMLLSLSIGAFGIYLPSFILSFFILRREGHDFFYIDTWKKRMRFTKFTINDLKWCLGGVTTTVLISYIFIQLIKQSYGELDYTPPFLDFRLSEGYKVGTIVAFISFWIINIMGIEVLFRGIMQPRQEKVLGSYAWLIQAFGLSVVFITFGCQLLFITLPLKFIIPYVVQRTQNTWNGVIIHGIVNAAVLLSIICR